ncbi:MAG: GTP cyclohydrolase IIa [Candidatus Altiarchaeota archaeon]
MIQLTLIQIDNYGPWTTNPLPKKESYLQMLQSEMYSELQKKFSAKKALLFPMRYDNMMAVTNGMKEKQHKEIMDAVNKKFPVSISMSIAVGDTPYEAQANATKQLSLAGGAKHAQRKAVLKAGGTSDGLVQIAHIDIDNITRHTDDNVYDSYKRVLEIENALITNLTPTGALVFFMGGDNFIAPCNNTPREDFLQAFEKIKIETGISLKAGIGFGKSADEAVHLAGMGLKEIRLGAREKILVKRNDA